MNVWARQAVRGFLYAVGGHPAAALEAGPGLVVRNPNRAPPWLVVEQEFSGLLIASWPGRLWEVEVLDPASAADHKAEKQSMPSASAGYTRAVAVKLIAERRASETFGANGEKVAALIERARKLTLDEAVRLAAGRHRNADRARTVLWRRWMMRQGIERDIEDDDYGDTLALFGTRERSPIGCGLTLIEAEVGKRAVKVSGSSVWRDSEIDPEGAALREPWGTAAAVLCDTALAVGTDGLVGRLETEVLLAAWRAFVGHSG